MQVLYVFIGFTGAVVCCCGVNYHHLYTLLLNTTGARWSKLGANLVRLTSRPELYLCLLVQLETILQVTV